jgi:hypothetical protein
MRLVTVLKDTPILEAMSLLHSRSVGFGSETGMERVFLCGINRAKFYCLRAVPGSVHKWKQAEFLRGDFKALSARLGA